MAASDRCELESYPRPLNQGYPHPRGSHRNRRMPPTACVTASSHARLACWQHRYYRFYPLL